MQPTEVGNVSVTCLVWGLGHVYIIPVSFVHADRRVVLGRRHSELTGSAVVQITATTASTPTYTFKRSPMPTNSTRAHSREASTDKPASSFLMLSAGHSAVTLTCVAGSQRSCKKR